MTHADENTICLTSQSRKSIQELQGFATKLSRTTGCNPLRAKAFYRMTAKVARAAGYQDVLWHIPNYRVTVIMKSDP